MMDQDYEDALHKAFQENFTNFTLNREAVILMYNAFVSGKLVKRTMPRMYEGWKDERGKNMVAVPQDQMKALLEVRETFGQLMRSQSYNLHGIDNSWKVSYKESASTAECVICNKSYNIKDMEYVEPNGIIDSGYYCPTCYEERFDNA